MANTFKVKSNAAMPSSSGTPDTIYTCGASGGAVVLGLVLANVHTSSVTASVKLESNTNDTETNENVFSKRCTNPNREFTWIIKW